MTYPIRVLLERESRAHATVEEAQERLDTAAGLASWLVARAELPRPRLAAGDSVRLTFGNGDLLEGTVLERTAHGVTFGWPKRNATLALAATGGGGAPVRIEIDFDASDLPDDVATRIRAQLERAIARVP